MNFMYKSALIPVIIFLIWGLAGAEVFCNPPAGKTIRFGPGKTTTDVLDLKYDGFTVVQAISSLHITEAETIGGKFTMIEGTGTASAPEYGVPLLPVINRLIEIPHGAEVVISVISYTEETIDLTSHGFTNPLFPRQPSVSKKEKDSQPPFIFHAGKYDIDAFSDRETAEIEELGMMRGRRIARLILSPVRYNPVRNQLKVLSEITIGISFRNIDFTGESRKQRFSSPFFEPAFSGRIINYHEKKTKTWFQGGPVKYVILSDPMFEEPLQEFIEWKSRKGFKVTELYRGQDGVGDTPAEMRAALSKLYHSAVTGDPPFTFLLIVGDHDQVPAFQQAGHVTDLYYAEYDGGVDFFPDVFYGRFSANNIEELIPQLEKTLVHEQYLFPDPDFLDDVLLISGQDSKYALTHGNGQVNYAAVNYFNEIPGLNTSSWPVPHPEGASAEIREMIRAGSSFINYTGHGLPDRWMNPFFHIDDIPSMHNDGKYPVMIGNACETNKFSIYECFGEALLRAGGKGAVGYIGASNDTYWDEDFYWAVGVGPISATTTFGQTGPGMYDRLFHMNGEPPAEWYVAQGQIPHSGNLAVSEASTIARARYYWEIYHLMGDPSLMIYFSQPDSMIPRYQETHPAGVSELVVYAEPFTYIALSGPEGLMDARYTNSSGNVRLVFDAIHDPGNYNLVVTAENRKPYSGSITVASPSEAFITLHSFSLDDSGSNHNGIAESGEKIGLDLTLLNKGISPGENITLSLSSDNEHVEVHDTVHVIPNIGPGEKITVKGIFGFDISSSIPDGESVFFRVKVSVNDIVKWTSDFLIDVKAPEVEIFRVWIDDSKSEVPDGYLMAGESAQMVMDIVNSGTAAIEDATFIINPTPGTISTDYNIFSWQRFNPGDTITITFTVSAPADIGYGSIVGAELLTRSRFFVSDDGFSLRVNTLFEDFEKGSFGRRPWQTDEGKEWHFCKDAAYGNFSIRSGDIGHSDTSELKIEMEVTHEGIISFYKKISSETKYDFLEFYINGGLAGRWSGLVNWSREEFSVMPGPVTFRWTYLKDKSVSSGLDRAWIDEVVFPPGILPFLPLEKDDDDQPGYHDLVITRLLNPVSGNGLTSMEIVDVEIENRGAVSLTGFDIIYCLDDLEPVQETFADTIGPGTIATYTFEKPVDLSVPGMYNLNLMLTGSLGSKTIHDSIIFEVENIISVIQFSPHDRQVVIYPNPFESFLDVRFDKASPFSGSVVLTSVNGVLLYSYPFTAVNEGEVLRIDTTRLKPGIYLLEISAGNERRFYKVVRL
jgi:hypothetical protein